MDFETVETTALVMSVMGNISQTLRNLHPPNKIYKSTPLETKIISMQWNRFAKGRNHKFSTWS